VELYSNIVIANPEFLVLLLLIPALFIWRYFKKPTHEAELNLSSISGLDGQSWRTWLAKILPILKLISFISLVIAISRPQTMLSEEEIKAEGIDIIVAMDVSTSMLAEDFRPNRIEVSKSLAIEFVGKRQYDRIGLVVFAGEAFTQCPLTTDHEILINFLARLQCGMLQDGTAIGMGLSSAVNRLKDSESKSKIIILLTDGVSNMGYIDPMTAADIASKFGIKVYTIGIGSNGRTKSANGFGSGGFRFGTVRGELDEELLKEIAGKTGGKYYRADTAEALNTIYEEIDTLEKTEIETSVINRYTEEYPWFLGLSLMLIMLGFLLQNTIINTFP